MALVTLTTLCEGSHDVDRKLGYNGVYDTTHEMALSVLVPEEDRTVEEG